MSVFLIPSSVVRDLEGLFREFLWANGENARGRCKIAWDQVCRPTSCGGLGIKRLAVWNRSLLVKHIWDILSHRESIWVRWIYLYCLRSTEFWLVRKGARWSWVLRKLLDLRPHVRGFFIKRIGNGLTTNAWEDCWQRGLTLSSFISYRFIHSNGLLASSTVRDICLRFSGTWPSEWVDRYPMLLNCPLPILDDSRRDELCWIDNHQNLVAFSVKVAWESLDGPHTPVHWITSVWFSGHIPKHAFCTWIACYRRLQTHDRMERWVGDNVSLLCPLCEVCSDSHNHLFFECSFSLDVWAHVKVFADLQAWPDRWEEIFVFLSDERRSPKNLIQKLALGAAVYFIWRERNNRLFEDRKCSVAQVYREIKEVVSMRVAWKIKNKRTLIADVN